MDERGDESLPSPPEFSAAGRGEGQTHGEEEAVTAAASQPGAREQPRVGSGASRQRGQGSRRKVEGRLREAAGPTSTPTFGQRVTPWDSRPAASVRPAGPAQWPASSQSPLLRPTCTGIFRGRRLWPRTCPSRCLRRAPSCSHRFQRAADSHALPCGSRFLPPSLRPRAAVSTSQAPSDPRVFLSRLLPRRLRAACLCAPATRPPSEAWGRVTFALVNLTSLGAGRMLLNAWRNVSCFGPEGRVFAWGSVLMETVFGRGQGAWQSDPKSSKKLVESL